MKRRLERGFDEFMSAESQTITISQGNLSENWSWARDLNGRNETETSALKAETFGLAPKSDRDKTLDRSSDQDKLCLGPIPGLDTSTLICTVVLYILLDASIVI